MTAVRPPDGGAGRSVSGGRLAPLGFL